MVRNNGRGGKAAQRAGNAPQSRGCGDISDAAVGGTANGCLAVIGALSTHHFANYRQGEIYGLSAVPSRFRLRGMARTPVGNLYLSWLLREIRQWRPASVSQQDDITLLVIDVV